MWQDMFSLVKYQIALGAGFSCKISLSTPRLIGDQLLSDYLLSDYLLDQSGNS
jgi:hypothetical protein